QEEQLRTVQEEKEFQRQKLQEEMEEYKEQSKQHSLTIVALEGRLLEAKRQQKTLEEEKAALVEKMEGNEGLRGMSLYWEPSWVTFAVTFVRKFREELAAAQSALRSKDAVIAGLTKELGETRARMSDMRGGHTPSLSQLCIGRAGVLTGAWLVQQSRKGVSSAAFAPLKSTGRVSDEVLVGFALGSCQVTGDFQRGCIAARFKLSSWRARCRLGENWSVVFFQEPALDLADLGAKCRGLRHEETIRRQKEGLAELRERVKTLEKGQSSAVMKKGSEPLVVLVKDLPEEIVQETGLKKEPAPTFGTKLKVGKAPGHVPNGGSHEAADGAASSERDVVTDLGEKMYLEVIGALGSLMKVEELSGMQSLKHLPLEEREKAGLQRRKGLELLYDKVRNLKSRLERKEEMVKDYEASVEQLRLNQASLRRCQEEMSKLEDEAYREAEEKALLKEALERTQLQLSQEKKLLRAAKLHKV
ncbi:FHAD1 protein, partial [Glareola pratincola]|nr:FHAD1 protein [Glareola pratincola]